MVGIMSKARNGARKKKRSQAREPKLNEALNESRIEEMTDLLRRVTNDDMPFDELEGSLVDEMNEALRRILEERLQRKSDALPETLEHVGKTWKKHLPGTVKYRSLVGVLEIARHTYRCMGVRNGPTVVPLDLSVGIVESMTRRLARSVAAGYAAGPLRRYIELMALAGRPVPPRATLERKAARLAAVLENDTPVLEPFVRASEPRDSGIHVISVGLDRTSTPMDEDPTPEELENRRNRPRPTGMRRSKGPRAVRYRMAYAGVIHLQAKNKKPLRTLRFSATAEDGPQRILERMKQETLALTHASPATKVVAVQDGAPELWNLLRPMLDDVAPNWDGLIDWYHVSQHLADAARAIHAKPAAQHRQLREWQSLLRCRSRASTKIAAEIDRHAEKRRGAAKRRLQNHADYLFFGESNLNFAKFRRFGWPLASGALEGACKSTIKERTNRSGQRWSNTGLRGVLAIRALADSGRLLSSLDHMISLRKESIADVIS